MPKIEGSEVQQVYAMAHALMPRYAMMVRYSHRSAP